MKKFEGMLYEYLKKKNKKLTALYT